MKSDELEAAGRKVRAKSMAGLVVNIIRILFYLTLMLAAAISERMRIRAAKHALSLVEGNSSENYQGWSPERVFEKRFLHGKSTIEDFERNKLEKCVKNYCRAKKETHEQIMRRTKVAQGKGDALLRGAVRSEVVFLQAIEAAIEENGSEFRVVEDMSASAMVTWERLIYDERQGMVESLSLLNAYCKARNCEPSDLLAKYPETK